MKYSKEFKEQAIKLSDEIGLKCARKNFPVTLSNAYLCTIIYSNIF